MRTARRVSVWILAVLALLPSSALAQRVTNGRVAVLAADTTFTPTAAPSLTSNPTMFGDVARRIRQTGLFARVDQWKVHAVGTSCLTVTADLLLDPFVRDGAEYGDYDAVLVYSNSAFCDRKGLGDALAGFIDAGRGVVFAPLSFEYAFPREDPGTGLAGLVLDGPTDRYSPLLAQDYTHTGDPRFQSGTLKLGRVAPHPILQRVQSFDGGSLSARHQPLDAIKNGANVIAWWSDGTSDAYLPLVATLDPAERGRTVAVNVFAAGAGALMSGNGLPDNRLWMGDGQWLFANSLVWASRRTEQGPSAAASLFPEPNARGWIGQPQFDAEARDSVTVRLEGFTGGSLANIASITYSAVGATTTSATVPVDGPGAHFETFLEIAAEGVTEIRYYATAADGLVSPEQTLYVRIDRTAPTVPILHPAGTYERGATVYSSYMCQDALSGVASCLAADGRSSGAPVGTSQLGTFTFSVIAFDVAGNGVQYDSAYTIAKASTSTSLRIEPAIQHQFLPTPWSPRLGEVIRLVADVYDSTGKVIPWSAGSSIEFFDESETPARLLGRATIDPQTGRPRAFLVGSLRGGERRIRARFPDSDPNWAASSSQQAAVAVIAETGSVKTWGRNDFGQLGNGSTSGSMWWPPQDARGLADAVAFGSGFNHSLAVTRDGSAWAWGYSFFGQTGTFTSPLVVPTKVNGISDVVAVTGGDGFSAALRADGTVWMWGDNAVGQLGRGNFSSPDPIPQPVPNFSEVVAIAAGRWHTVALRADGSVWAWGRNDSGMLGVNAAGHVATPRQVSGLRNIAKIAAGWSHSLALGADGGVWTWGFNNGGQLGDGGSASRATPMRLANPQSAIAIAGESSASAAIDVNGQLWAWGVSPYVNSTLPVRLPAAPSPVADVKLAQGAALVLRPQDRSVWAWGSGYQSTPTQVSGIATVRQFASGQNHAGAVVGADSLAPTVAVHVNPPNVTWATPSASVTLTASDVQSGVKSLTYGATGANPIATTTIPSGGVALTISGEGISTITYSAADNVGNASAPESVTVRVDPTAPVVISPFGAPQAPTLRVGQPFTLDFSCTDATSGISACFAQVISSNGSVIAQQLLPGDLLPTTQAGTFTVHMTAIDAAGNKATLSRAYTVSADTTAPTITITEPYGRLFRVGQQVKVVFGCTDTESQVTSCFGQQGPTSPAVPSGATLDTSTAGAFAFTITGRDAAGNVSTATLAYTVGKRLDLLVADNLGNRILAYDLDNLQRGPLPFIEGNGLTNPTCMVEHLGYLFVCNPTRYEILRFNAITGEPAPGVNLPGAVFATNVGNRGPYSGPAGLTVGPDGDLYVSTNLGGVIERYNRETGAPRGVSPTDLTLFANVGKQHNSSSFGPDGNLYVANFTPASVPRFNGQTGAFINEFLSDSWLNARNADLAWGPDGLFYLGARYDGQLKDPVQAGGYIHRYDLNGNGVPGPGFGVAFGRAPVVELAQIPGLMAFGPDGRLYVSTWTYGGEYGLVQIDPAVGQGSRTNLPLPAGAGPSGVAFSRDIVRPRLRTSVRFSQAPGLEYDGVGYHATFSGGPKLASATAANALNEPVGPVTITYNGSPDPPVQAGRYEVIAAFEGDEGNEPSSTSTYLIIEPAPVSIRIEASETHYDGQPRAATITVTPEAPYSVTYNGSTDLPINAGEYEVVVRVDDLNYVPTTASARLIIHRARPDVEIRSPRSIVYGTPLPVIDVRTEVPGTFEMTPQPGTLLPAGTHRLSVRFIPADTGNYFEIEFTESITVDQAIPQIEFGDLTVVYNGQPQPMSGRVTGVMGEAPWLPEITYAGSVQPPTDAGVYPVVARFVGDDNYTPVEATATLTIGRAMPKVVVTGGTSTYDGQPHPAFGEVLGVTGERIAAPTITYNGEPAAPIRAGRYDVVAEFAGNSNYLPAKGVASITINRAAAMVTVTGGMFVYDAQPHVATARVTGIGGEDLGAARIAYYRDDGNPLPEQPVDAGSYHAVASFDGDRNYEPATGRGALVINRRTPKVVVRGGTFTYDGAPHGASGEVLGLDAKPIGAPVLTYNGQSSAPVNAGIYQVLGVFAGDRNYQPAEGTATIVINKATAVVSVTGGAFTYNGQPHATTATVKGVNGEDLGVVTLSYNGDAQAPVAAGSYTVLGTFAGDGNYQPAEGTATIVINKATAVVSVTGGTFTYNGQPHAATARVKGVNGEDLGVVTLFYNGDPNAPIAGGSYTVLGTFAGDGNYQPAKGTATIVINKATAVVSVTGGSFTYDGQPHAATASVTGVNGEDLGLVTLTYNGTLQVPVDSGRYPVVGSFAGDGNYESAQGTAIVDIARANATIVVTGGTFTYDGQPHAASAVARGVNGEDLGIVVVTYWGDPRPPADAGTYGVIVTFAGDRNYEFASGQGTLIIEKAAARLSVSGGTVIYDGRPHPASGRVAGVNGEDIGTVTFAYNGGTAVPVDAGTYTVVGSFAGNNNYERAERDATIVINKATATVTVFGGTFIYDGQVHGASGQVVGVMGEDLGAVTFTYNGGEALPVNAGSYEVVAAFAGNRNYEPARGGATIVIDKAVPVVTWDPPAAIVHGQLLGAAQLNATANVAGTFTYTPAAGTLLAADSQLLSVTFTPADAVNYTEQTATTTLVVMPAATTTQVTSSLNPARANETVTFTARVVVVAPGAGTPTGSVTFFDGSTALGTGAVTFDGVSFVATLTTTLAGGDHSITAQYGGTSNHRASTSAAVIQTVFGAPAEPGRPADPGPPANPPGRGRGRP